jgi:putative transposase
MTTARMRYPSDLTGPQWGDIAHLFPPGDGSTGRPRTYPLRQIVSARLHPARGGCPWRMRPHDFPPWKTVPYSFYTCPDDGTRGREPTPTAGVIDRRSAKTTEVGGPEGYDGGKGGRPQAAPARGHPRQARALAEWVTANARWACAIVPKWPGQTTFEVQRWRRAAERTSGWFGRYRRLSEDDERDPRGSEAWIGMAMIHRMSRLRRTRTGMTTCRDGRRNAWKKPRFSTASKARCSPDGPARERIHPAARIFGCRRNVS